MDVYEAVDSRRAVRAFSGEPVPKQVLERVLGAAARAPSSGNLQPWLVFVVAGEPLVQLKSLATARALNTDAFGAPVVLFCFVDPAMGQGQWADIGMYVQTVMLLLRAEGLHSCPQVMWTTYRRTVCEAVGVAGLVLHCGVAVGYEDEAAPRLRTGRADVEETVTFVGL